MNPTSQLTRHQANLQPTTNGPSSLDVSTALPTDAVITLDSILSNIVPVMPSTIFRIFREQFKLLSNNNFFSETKQEQLIQCACNILIKIKFMITIQQIKLKLHYRLDYLLHRKLLLNLPHNIFVLTNFSCFEPYTHSHLTIKKLRERD